MILALDIGNSSIVAGGFDEKDLLFTARLRTDTTKTSDEYCIDLMSILDVHGFGREEVAGSIIASVVPQVTNACKTALRKLCGTAPLVVGPGLRSGLNLKIENPSHIGADLVVGAVAALKEHKPPMIVVDMGTATSMIVLDENGTLVGGSICPGVQVSLDALTSRTALLPGLQLDQPRHAIGKNTIECMRSGVMLGAASMLDGMVERMEQELGSKTTVILTGRIAKFIQPLCRTSMVYDSNLTLKGLITIYLANTEKKHKTV